MLLGCRIFPSTPSGCRISPLHALCFRIPHFTPFVAGSPTLRPWLQDPLVAGFFRFAPLAAGFLPYPCFLLVYRYLIITVVLKKPFHHLFVLKNLFIICLY